MKPSNLQTKKRNKFIPAFRAKVLNLKQGLTLNDKSERHAELLLSTFPHMKEGFFAVLSALLHTCTFYSTRVNFKGINEKK